MYLLPLLRYLLVSLGRNDKIFNSFDLVGTGKCHWHLNLKKSQPLVLLLVILDDYECPLILNLLLLLSKE